MVNYSQVNQNIQELLKTVGIFWSIEKVNESPKLESLRTLMNGGETPDWMKMDYLSLYNLENND